MLHHNAASLSNQLWLENDKYTVYCGILMQIIVSVTAAMFLDIDYF